MTIESRFRRHQGKEQLEFDFDEEVKNSPSWWGMVKAVAFAALFVFFMSLFVKPAQSNELMIEQMLEPSAIVLVGRSTGSATAIKVDPIMGTYLVTNYHVVEDDMDEVKVRFYGEEESHDAYVHSIDIPNDLAVIITHHKHDAVVTIGEAPSVFDEVFCVGSPMGMPTAPSKGMVTGTDVETPDGKKIFTRMDCHVAPGNSGGGMFAKQEGEWKYIGVPAMVAMIPTGFSGRAPVTFLGFAIRIEDVLSHLWKNNVITYPTGP